MNLFNYLKNCYQSTKKHLKSSNLDSLLWLLDLIPSIVGFSVRKDRIWVPFWVLHISALIYVYGVSSIVYQWKHAQGAGDLMKTCVTLSLFVLILNSSWWFIKKRSLLTATLKDMELSDCLSRRSTYLGSKHERLMKIIKWIIFVFYVSMHLDAFLFDLPHRVSALDISITPCVGIEPLTISPNREVCLTIVVLQELTALVVVLYFQALILLLIGHTSIMYQMLSNEMMYLNENADVADIKEMAKKTLPGLVSRHSLTLKVIKNLKALYSVPLGVNFGSNAICMSLFFSLPLREWFQFLGIIAYCFGVFFLYCILGQRLINASEEFERWVYCCGWENFDHREKKLVYMMLRQAQQPVQLLAADIIPVNIYTFAKTLQAIFKFVTVLKV